MRNLVLQNAAAARWLAFFGTILAAWIGLFVMQFAGQTADLSGLYGVSFWASLCGHATAEAGFFSVVSMWALMSGAMMAPTFAPTLKTYQDLTHTEAAGSATFAALLGAYLAVWLGFSLLAGAAQLWLADMALIGIDGASRTWGLTAVLLGVAGLYQFSGAKDSCLTQCRAPMTFFMAHWSPGVSGAARMGLRLGLICLGCCWALMALAFVGGTMNLLWMGLATLLMVVEKLPDIGRYVTRPLGVVLLGAAFGSALLSLELF